MNDNIPLISIAMATYNGQKFIIDQLDSITNQTYKNFEIIVCDDKSTDSTFEILQNYKTKYPLKLIQNYKNLGIVSTFENALKLCNGDFIALSDQDDIFFPEKLEILLNNIGDFYLIHSDSIIIDEFNKITFRSHFRKFKDINKKSFVDYLSGNNVTGNSILIRKELLSIALPFPKSIRIHDHYLALCASYYNKIILYPKPLQYYRQHLSNAIGIKKNSYETFLKNTRKDIKNYISFLKLFKFTDNEREIKIFLELKIAIVRGNYKTQFSILNNLKIKGFLRLYIVYLILNPIFPYRLRFNIYNFLNTLR